MIQQIKELEDSIIKKSNKYVYFSDGTHMTFSDFHHLKQDIRNEYTRVNFSDVVNSIKTIATCKSKLAKLEEQAYLLETQVNIAQQSNENITTIEDYKRWWEESTEKNDKLNSKLYKIGNLLYKNLSLYVEGYQTEGTKFIIQSNEQEEYRFCFDPLEFGSNMHSSLSELFRDWGKWSTLNGGWMKVEGDNIILYAQSGDYGVYDDEIATCACKKLFPSKNITSYAGKSLNEVR